MNYNKIGLYSLLVSKKMEVRISKIECLYSLLKYFFFTLHPHPPSQLYALSLVNANSLADLHSAPTRHLGRHL